MTLSRFFIGLIALGTFLAIAVGHAAEPATKTTEYTLAMIKPNAVRANHIGEIINRLEKGGLRVVGLKMDRLSTERAQEFYAEHKERSFFDALVKFMTSGPIVAIVVEGPDAVAKNRAIMGATDPSKAARGTIRADLGENLTENAIHGSDSPESAKREVAFFFKPNEIFSADAQK